MRNEVESKNVYDLLERSERMANADELIVDLFAGGGGASLGIERATGISPHIAVNHDSAAISVHQVNHLDTIHYQEDVWQVDPIEATQGKSVGDLWMSPDCKYFSRSRGAAPVSPRIRSLPWAGVKWGGMVKPKRIYAENVPEIVDWGPVIAKRDPKTGRVIKLDGTVASKGERVPVQDQQLVPDKKRAGQTYKRFIKRLEQLGYTVETKILVAADYGAPTTRKRWFMIARCDGQPIVWPEATHAKKDSEAVINGEKKPWVPVSECIDWEEPAYSIFLTKEQVKQHKLPCRRPLADGTMNRIAKGLDRYVINNADPFVVHVQNSSSTGLNDINEPIRTITANPKGGGYSVAIPFMVKNYSGVIGHDIDRPIGAITTVDHHSIAMAHVYRDFGQSIGSGPDQPVGTITAAGNGKAGVVLSYFSKFRGTNIGGELVEPLDTITAGGNHFAEIRAFLVRYHGSEKGGHGIEGPLGAITSKDEYGLVLVVVDGETYVLIDVLLRMLTPRELFRAQGFPDSYIVEYGYNGERLSKVDQVRLVGNSVPPQLAEAIVKANYSPVDSLDYDKIAA